MTKWEFFDAYLLADAETKKQIERLLTQGSSAEDPGEPRAELEKLHQCNNGKKA